MIPGRHRSCTLSIQKPPASAGSPEEGRAPGQRKQEGAARAVQTAGSGQGTSPQEEAKLQTQRLRHTEPGSRAQAARTTPPPNHTGEEQVETGAPSRGQAALREARQEAKGELSAAKGSAACRGTHPGLPWPLLSISNSALNRAIYLGKGQREMREVKRQKLAGDRRKESSTPTPHCEELNSSF